MLLDSVQDDDVAVQLVASLLIDEAAEVLRLAELRWSLGQMHEESLISLIKALKHFLHSLTMQQTTRDAFGEMLLHRIQPDVSAEHLIVPLLQRKSVVPYETALAKHSVNLAIALALIECVFVCHHSTTIQFVNTTNLLKIYVINNTGALILRFHPLPKDRGFPA